MIKTYRCQDASGPSKLLATSILDLMLNSGLTYVELKDALDYAEGLLTNATQPVRADHPQLLD